MRIAVSSSFLAGAVVLAGCGHASPKAVAPAAATGHTISVAWHQAPQCSLVHVRHPSSNDPPGPVSPVENTACVARAVFEFGDVEMPFDLGISVGAKSAASSRAYPTANPTLTGFRLSLGHPSGSWALWGLDVEAAAFRAAADPTNTKCSTAAADILGRGLFSIGDWRVIVVEVLRERRANNGRLIVEHYRMPTAAALELTLVSDSGKRREIRPVPAQADGYWAAITCGDMVPPLSGSLEVFFAGRQERVPFTLPLVAAADTYTVLSVTLRDE